jgi:hypothetical protein
VKCRVCGREFSKWDEEHDYGHEHVCGSCRDDAARQVREAKRAFYGNEGGDE